MTDTMNESFMNDPSLPFTVLNHKSMVDILANKRDIVKYSYIIIEIFKPDLCHCIYTDLNPESLQFDHSLTFLDMHLQYLYTRHKLFHASQAHFCISCSLPL